MVFVQLRFYTEVVEQLTQVNYTSLLQAPLLSVCTFI